MTSSLSPTVIASEPLTLCGAIVVGDWAWPVPDGNAPIPFLQLAIPVILLGRRYLVLAFPILMLDPAQTSLKTRLAGFSGNITFR